MVMLDRTKHIELVLKQVNVTGKLVEDLGKIHVVQQYENNTDENLEVVYRFPLNVNDNITGFKFTVNDTTTVGVLKDISIAQQEYTDAVENKKVTVMLTRYGSTYEVKIGNVEPNARVSIEFTYITTIDFKHAQYKFVLPMNIAPKYQPTQYDVTKYTTDRSLGFDVFLDIQWQSDAKIMRCTSLTHPNQIQLTEQDTIARFDYKVNPFDGDFNLILETDVNAYPKVYSFEKDEEVYYSAIVRIPTVKETNIAASEYIILVDRSGSMETNNKMESAIISTVQFIANLRECDKFNIISFGSKYEKMYDTSIDASLKNVKDACNKLKQFKANMGGTELISCFNELFKENEQQKNDDMPRSFFVMTDGQIGNVDTLTKLISEKKRNSDRIFALGIGNDADRTLINSLANVGNGDSIMIVDVEKSKIAMAVLELYEISHTKYYRNIRMQASDGTNIVDIGQYLLQSQNDSIVPNKIVKIYMKMPIDIARNLKHFILTGEPNMEYQIDVDKCTVEPVIMQHYGAQLINKLTEKDDIIAASLKYNILSRYTSFIAVSEETVTADSQLQHIVSHYRPVHAMAMAAAAFADADMCFESCAINVVNRGAPVAAFAAPAPNMSSVRAQSERMTAQSHRIKSASFNFINPLSKINSAVSNKIENVKEKITNALIKTLDDYQEKDGSFKNSSGLKKLLPITDEEIEETMKVYNVDKHIAFNICVLNHIKNEMDYIDNYVELKRFLDSGNYLKNNAVQAN